MKYVDEFRKADGVKKLLNKLHCISTQPWTIMEICGGQTHAIVKYGIDTLLPDGINLLHGPGCPVCITPVELIDKATMIASLNNVIFCSYGDMLRVPGTEKNLFTTKSEGGDIRIVYSPLDALSIARENPDKQVVFFAIGFETTAPANAMAIYQADKEHLSNFSVLVSQSLVPPGVELILSSPNNHVQGFLAAGHVCTVMGYEEYVPIAEKYTCPIVVTGFEPADILLGIYQCVSQFENNIYTVENAYTRAVTREGNHHAQTMMQTVFEPADRTWRGIGMVKQGGYKLRSKYAHIDAEQRFSVADYRANENPDCISGLIMQGLKKPNECPMFASHCTPEFPLGATMVSSEGACASYYKYRNK